MNKDIDSKYSHLSSALIIIAVVLMFLLPGWAMSKIYHDFMEYKSLKVQVEQLEQKITILEENK